MNCDNPSPTTLSTPSGGEPASGMEGGGIDKRCWRCNGSGERSRQETLDSPGTHPCPICRPEEAAAGRSMYQPAPKTFAHIGYEIGQLCNEKNIAYGNSFGTTGEFLRLLYPDGVKPEQYSDMLLVVRIYDKLSRIAHNKEAYSESPYRDIAGYALLGVAKDEKR